MFCASVLYPSNEGSAFDFERCASTLAPMYARFLGDNCVRFEVRKGLMTPAPKFICIASYWVESREEYAASLGTPQFMEIMRKFAAFTDIEPVRQFDEIVTPDVRGPWREAEVQDDWREQRGGTTMLCKGQRA